MEFVQVIFFDIRVSFRYLRYQSSRYQKLTGHKISILVIYKHAFFKYDVT